MSTDLEATLQERGERYGCFIDHATITQELKRVIEGWSKAKLQTLEPDQQEALEMICHKIGRIINGDPDYVDHWVDIAGYSMLVANRLNGTLL